MKKNWILFSLFNFFIAALMGLILRGAFVWEIGWLDYRNMMHGHSHVAMLGWVYLALYSLIWYRFIPKRKRIKPIYSRLFWFTQMTVVGMMISFPLQGYAAVSISFSSLHILSSYVFCYRVWKDHKTKVPEVGLLLKTALGLLAVSTIGVWILGPLAISGGRSSTLYQLAIQFYLHFQFHGWFTFAVLALLLDALTQGFTLKEKQFKWFYSMLITSTILTYGLVLAWGYGGIFTLIINGMGLVFQLLALILFFRLIRESNRKYSLKASSMVSAFYRFGLISWVLKICIQSAVLVPSVAVVSFTIRSFMIGFIHLTMLGFVSGLVFGLLFGSGALAENRSGFAGMVTFIAGFALTELLLFVQGLSYWFQRGQVPAYYEMIFGFSTLLPIGIMIIFFTQIKNMDFKRGQNHLLS
jgi:hypothetical protein